MPGVVQVLPLRGMAVVAPSAMEDGSILLAGTEAGVQRLSCIPFEQQARTLADLEEFQEGLGLAQLLPDSQVSLLSSHVGFQVSCVRSRSRISPPFYPPSCLHPH